MLFIFEDTVCRISFVYLYFLNLARFFRNYELQVKPEKRSTVKKDDVNYLHVIINNMPIAGNRLLIWQQDVHSQIRKVIIRKARN